MKTKTKQKVTKTVGSKIVRDLRKLNRVLAAGGNLHDHFTVDRIVLSLRPREYQPEMVSDLRKSLGMSQAIFAQFLGVSASTIRSWEQGQNPVPGMARRFFDEITRDPVYWQKRLCESVKERLR